MTRRGVILILLAAVLGTLAVLDLIRWASGQGAVLVYPLAPTEPAASDHVAAAAILGPDDRLQVVDSTIYPYRALAHYQASRGSSTFACTGGFLTPNVMVTAAHCLMHPGGPATSVKVYPARNSPSPDPFGFAFAEAFAIPVLFDGGLLDDYAVVYMGADFEAPAVLPVGIAELGAFSLAGYPGDKPYGSLWESLGDLEEFSGSVIFHDADTYGGYSGGPMIQDGRTIGIHHGTTGEENLGLLLNQRVRDGLDDLCAAIGCEGVPAPMDFTHVLSVPGAAK